jgi:glycogen operon protein
MDCLHYWVTEMHVDGFRFDLASILGRDQDGEVLSNPPMVEMIAEDPLLADTKIIAEAWDAAGLYQVGHFSPHVRWAEWNGKFRDDVRAFMCGRVNSVSPLATRIAGSSDLYQHDARRPFNSINFITSHDGFTLADLVSYEKKHNDQNGEGGRDGDNNNISWNSGIEGPSRSAKIQKLRERRMKTFGVILFLSQGTPMMTAGDEFCRTQRGNNNAYCQDNEISWLDWRLAEKNAAMVRFFRLLISLRKNHSIFRREDFFTAEDHSLTKEIIWQSIQRGEEDWSSSCKTLAFFLSGSSDSSERDNAFCVLLNGSLETQTFHLPFPASGQKWFQIIDTAAPSPDDIVSEKDAAPVLNDLRAVAEMSAVVFMGKNGGR